MSKNLLLVACFGIMLFGGYHYLEMKRALEAKSKDNAQPASIADSTAQTMPGRSRLEALREEVAAQEKTLAGLDAKLSELLKRQSNSITSQKRDEVSVQSSRVAELENQLAYYRASVASGRLQVSKQKQQNEFARRSAIEDAGARVRRAEQQLKELNRRISNSRKNHLSPGDLTEALENVKQLQAEISAARRQGESARAYNPATGLAMPDASAIKEVQNSLNEEKKRLRELQQQFAREEKADDALFHERDKVENEYQNARIRLQKLKDQLKAAQTGDQER